jgi:hypothetical protein
MPLYNFFWFLSVIAISITPVTCFFIYAQQKENNLLIKAQQLDIAEKIETRLSKLELFDKVVKKKAITDQQRAEFFFTNGVYDNRCVTVKKDTKPFSDSVFPEPYDQVIGSISWGYKSLDKMLPGQDTAVDKKWYRDDLLKLHPAQMTLIYKLNSENKNADITGEVNSLEIKCSNTTIFEYFKIDNRRGIFVIVVISLLLLWAFFRLIRTVTSRLFHSWNLKDEKMINGHNKNIVRNQLIKNEYHEYNGIEELLSTNKTNAGAKQVLRKLLGIPLPCLPDEPDIKYQSLKEIWEKEYEHSFVDKTNPIRQDDVILYNQYHLSALYENLWNLCSKEEKYFLYDMARDGFVNYKRAHLVQQLLYKGLLVNYNNEELKIMSVSFRNYILDKGKSEEVIKLKEEFQVQGTWSKLRTPVNCRWYFLVYYPAGYVSTGCCIGSYNKRITWFRDFDTWL